jgi:polar amino acid transport system substrate-binding protein
MFAKDAPLAAKVNDAISAMKKDGTMASIYKTWFGADPESGLATVTVMDMPKP